MYIIFTIYSKVLPEVNHHIRQLTVKTQVPIQVRPNNNSSNNRHNNNNKRHNSPVVLAHPERRRHRQALHSNNSSSKIHRPLLNIRRTRKDTQHRQVYRRRGPIIELPTQRTK